MLLAEKMVAKTPQKIRNPGPYLPCLGKIPLEKETFFWALPYCKHQKLFFGLSEIVICEMEETCELNLIDGGLVTRMKKMVTRGWCTPL